MQWRRDVGDVNSFPSTPVNKKELSGSKLSTVRLLSMINMIENVPADWVKKLGCLIQDP